MTSGANRRRLEGIVSALVILVIIGVARSTRHPALMILADVVVYLCIIAAVAWLVRAAVRKARR